MLRWGTPLVGIAVALAAVGVASAQMGGWAMGPGGMGRGPHGPGMACQFEPATMLPAAKVTAESAREIAQRYADEHLKGFSVERVLPFTGMRGMAMYAVELKGPQDEMRTLHVNPWGGVMPWAGPWRRGAAAF